jgi:voltage-gated potassium channel
MSAAFRSAGPGRDRARPSRMTVATRRRGMEVVVDRLRVARKHPARQLRLSLAVLFGLVVAGTFGFMFIEGYDFLEALYFTVITLTTVGYGEPKPLDAAGRVFAIVLIVMGVSVVAWAASNAVEIMLGEAYWVSRRRERIREVVMRLKDHFVVCGYGRLGRQIVRDLVARGEAFVVIEANAELEDEMAEHEVPHVLGDATQEETLLAAGIENARGLVSCLDSDANNVLTILTARDLNSRLLIVARSNSEAAESRLRRAGADRMVTPEIIGGHRLALALLRPAVHDFFGRVFSTRVHRDYDVGQVTIHEGSPFAGQTVATCDLRRMRSVTILAIRKPDGAFDLNPAPTRAIESGDTMILIGPAEAIYELEAMYSGGAG